MQHAYETLRGREFLHKKLNIVTDPHDFTNALERSISEANNARICLFPGSAVWFEDSIINLLSEGKAAIESQPVAFCFH